MKRVLIGAAALLSLAACDEATPKGQTAPKTKDFVDAKLLDLKCTGKRNVGDKSEPFTLVYHFDLNRMTYSVGNDPDLGIIHAIDNAAVAIYETERNAAYVNRGSGRWLVYDYDLRMTIEGTCDPAALTELGRKF